MQQLIHSLTRTSLFALILLGSHLIGQAQTAKVEQPKIEQPKIEQPKIKQHGWKLVYVTYKDEKSLTQGDDKQYGEPSVALFVKDYPYQEGKEYPKLLVMYLSEDIVCDDKRPRVRKTIDEFDSVGDYSALYDGSGMTIERRIGGSYQN